MTTIWKFQLSLEGHTDLTMPVGLEVLSVQVQKGVPCLWARCNPSAALEPRRFVAVATGESTRRDKVGDFIGTYQLAGGALVYHLFHGP